MAGPGIELDYAAIGEILRVTTRSAINTMAGAVATNAAANGDLPDNATVTVKPFTTDRAASVVMLRHPESMALEVKHGILKRAAAAAGLEVTAK